MKTNFLQIVVVVLSILYRFPSITRAENTARDSLLFQEPQRCSLSSNTTFSWSILSCVKCQWKQNDQPDSCPCPSRLREVHEMELYSPIGNQLTDKCAVCPDKMVVYDGKHCLQCGDLNPFNNAAGRCDLCPAGHIEVIYNLDGTPKEKVVCEKCANGYHPSSNLRTCIPCHPSFIHDKSGNGTCSCPESDHKIIDGVCFPIPDRKERDPGINLDTKNAFKIDYDRHRADSYIFKEHLRLSNLLCKEDKQNQTACQILANLCTLNLHNYGYESTACDLYRKVFSGAVSHPPPYVPRLYYTDIEAPAVLAKSTAIPQKYNMDFSSRSSDINITTAKFTFDGKFLGLSDLSESIPCSDPPLVQGISRKFGSTYKTHCSMGIQQLWEKYKKEPMTFLDPYVSYLDGYNFETHLYSIPVKIINFKRSGLRTNVMDDKYQWQLVHRFFMVDTIGGFEDANINGTPSHVRYVSEMHVRIQLQNSKEPGRIYVPLITLTYKDMTKDEFLRNEQITFDFSVTYMMDMSRSLEDVKISVGVISALAVIWAAIQTWSWNRRNGRVEVDIETIVNLFITSCGHLADAFFIVCFGTALYWFIFFKKQAVVHVMLPDPLQERLIRDLLISAFALKIVDILKLLYRQSNIDIFFIDWERPKARSTIQAPNERSSRAAGGDSAVKSEIGLAMYHDKNESVSIWRTYFVANEWNEIQTSRKINIPAQIILSLFFLEVIGFKYWALYWPDGSLSPGPEAEHIPFSTSARFAVATLVFGIIGICQWLYRIGFYERFIEDEIQDFVDLCTLGNISVFILAAKQHGYYIHGRSVHGFADTDMQTMIEQLNREEEDLCSRRGLLPQTDQQTFLISVPNTFRNVYNQVLQPLYATSNSVTPFLGRGRQLSITASKVSLGSANKPTANMLNLSIHAYHSMNRFLTAFLEHALSDLDYDVKDKSFFETTFDMEFSEVGSDRAVFYTDNGHSFDSVLFYGNERTLFMFNLYTFIFVDILSHNFVLAGIVTFLIDLVIKSLRNFFGKRNLARKTLIDSRFLI
ncbi:unnamed protein product [Orchesella dallaii]|uniref:Meckelin n=1 Tax=Orchesella dallaii TaxID=48710 RepID=A0ABP1PWC3_9HEXA